MPVINILEFGFDIAEQGYNLLLIGCAEIIADVLRDVWRQVAFTFRTTLSNLVRAS